MPNNKDTQSKVSLFMSIYKRMVIGNFIAPIFQGAILIRIMYRIFNERMIIISFIQKLEERFADKSYDKLTTYRVSDTIKVVIITHYNKRGVPTYKWSYMADMDGTHIVHLAP